MRGGQGASHGDLGSLGGAVRQIDRRTPALSGMADGGRRIGARGYGLKISMAVPVHESPCLFSEPLSPTRIGHQGPVRLRGLVDLCQRGLLRYEGSEGEACGKPISLSWAWLCGRPERRQCAFRLARVLPAKPVDNAVVAIRRDQRAVGQPHGAIYGDYSRCAVLTREDGAVGDTPRVANVHNSTSRAPNLLISRLPALPR